MRVIDDGYRPARKGGRARRHPESERRQSYLQPVSAGGQASMRSIASAFRRAIGKLDLAKRSRRQHAKDLLILQPRPAWRLVKLRFAARVSRSEGARRESDGRATRQRAVAGGRPHPPQLAVRVGDAVADAGIGIVAIRFVFGVHHASIRAQPTARRKVPSSTPAPTKRPPKARFSHLTCRASRRALRTFAASSGVAASSRRGR